MKALLLAVLLLPLCAYFGVIAFAPRILALPCGAVPLSLPLALGLIWLGFLVTILYVRHANRREGGQS
jgi:uncharacterized membrane protein (DUF485 family)